MLYHTGYSQRAGRRVRQPLGYTAFIPKPLPPDPPLRINHVIKALLSEADQALEQLDGIKTGLPDFDLYQEMYVRKEAVLSSRIEGVRGTFWDSLLAEAKVHTAYLPDDIVEVVNYVRATDYGIQRLSSLPLCTRLIREIHRELMEGVRGNYSDPGEIRRSQNWIGGPGSTLNTAVFVPPPPHELAQACDELERFLHQHSHLPPIIQAGLAHVQFEMIHPFLDGNGRAGRLLITLFLHERKLLKHPVLYVSSYILANQMEYYERLRGVQDAGDWEGWTKYFLKAVIAGCNESVRTTRAVLQLREGHTQLISDQLEGEAEGGLRILTSLFRQPLFQTNQLAESTGLTDSAANNLVARLEDLGIVRKITESKDNRLFCYEQYVNLFSDVPIEPVSK